MQPAVLPAWVAPPRDVLAGAPATGLDRAEAERRLAEFGFNEPVAPSRVSPVRQILERFSNPLVLVLLLASVVSGVLGDVENAAIVFGIVVLGVAIESLKMRRANRAAESLAARVAHTIAQPRRWDIRVIRRFMLWIAPVSSVFDLLTFWYLLRQLHAGHALFHPGWFVESLVTQTLAFLFLTVVAYVASVIAIRHLVLREAMS
jgi:magnesium-transporting ATPase (P-type)